MNVLDGTYSKIIAEYKESLDKVNLRIRQLKQNPAPDGKRLALLCKQRYELSQAIKSMSRYTKE